MKSVMVDADVAAALDLMKRDPFESRNSVLRELLDLPEKVGGRLDLAEVERRIRAGEAPAAVASALGYNRQAVEYQVDRLGLRAIVEAERERRREQHRLARRRGRRVRHSEEDRARPQKHVRLWSDEELLAGLRRAATELGEPLSLKKFEAWLAEPAQGDLPFSQRTFVTRLSGGTGRWRDVLERAGLALPHREAGPTPIAWKDCLMALDRVAGVVGRIPTWEEYERLHLDGEPSSSTIRSRTPGGKWSGVVAAMLERQKEAAQ